MPYSGGFVFPVAPDMHAAVQEGGYFTVNAGQTGIATAAAVTAFSDTNPFACMFNAAAVGGQNMYLDYVLFQNTAIGTGGTAVFAAVQLDFGVDRYTSGGTVLTTSIFNPNGSAANQTSNARFRAGNLTVSAKTSASKLIVGQRCLKGAIPVAGDTHVLKFGGLESFANISASAVVFSTQNCPKIVIPPQASCNIYLWSPSQSGATSWIIEAGWIERP